jgi:hypothetical protein
LVVTAPPPVAEADAEADAEAEALAEAEADAVAEGDADAPLFWPQLLYRCLLDSVFTEEEEFRQCADAVPATRAKVPPDPTRASTAISTRCLVLNRRRRDCCSRGIKGLISSATQEKRPLGGGRTWGTW